MTECINCQPNNWAPKLTPQQEAAKLLLNSINSTPTVNSLLERIQNESGVEAGRSLAALALRGEKPEDMDQLNKFLSRQPDPLSKALLRLLTT